MTEGEKTVLPSKKENIEQNNSEKEDEDMLYQLSRYYHYLRLKKKVLKYRSKNGAYPALILVRENQYEMFREKGMAQDTEVQILEFNADNSTFKEPKIKKDNDYFMIVAVPLDMVIDKGGRKFLRTDLKINRFNTLAMYYQVDNEQ